MATNAEIATMLSERYPAFASVDPARLALFAADARLVVPECRVPVQLRDLALMYKTASLAQSAPDLSSSLSTGVVKARQVGKRREEYAVDGASSQQTSISFESLYQNLVRPYARNSPRVLGFRG